MQLTGVVKRMLEESEHLLNSVLPVVPYRQWCLSLPFDLRYLLAWNADMRSAVLQALLRAITRYYTVQAALAGVEGPVHTGAITVIQRFSSDLRLNLHYHVLYADGVWTEEDGEATFHPAPPLGELDVQEVLLDAQLRIDRQLKKHGWQDRSDNPFADREPALSALMQASIRGQLFDPPEVPPRNTGTNAQERALPKRASRNCASSGGYSLHADRRIAPLDREELAFMVRYLCRPAVAAERLTELGDGQFALKLKTAFKDGTTSVQISALDLVSRLSAQVPLPRSCSIRYSGVFAPNAHLRPLVVLAGDQAPTRRKKVSGDGAVADVNKPAGVDPLELERKASTRLTWAQALRAAYKIDILTCEKCGGTKQVIAAIPAGAIATKILRHLGLPTQVVTKAAPCDVWRVRGPPGELDDFGDDEPQVHSDAIDEEYEEIGMRPFFDDEEEQLKAA